MNYAKFEHWLNQNKQACKYIITQALLSDYFLSCDEHCELSDKLYTAESMQEHFIQQGNVFLPVEQLIERVLYEK